MQYYKTTAIDTHNQYSFRCKVITHLCDYTNNAENYIFRKKPLLPVFNVDLNSMIKTRSITSPTFVETAVYTPG